MLAAAVALVAATAVPAHTGPVVDTSDLVPAPVEQRVDQSLADYQDRIGIVVVDTTGGMPADDYAAAVSFVWSVPDVLVVAVHDGSVGVAGVPGKPVLDVVVPRLHQGAVDDAVELGAAEMRRALGDTSVPAPPRPVEAAPRSTHHRSFPWVAPIVALLAAAGVAARAMTRRRRLGWAQLTPARWGSGWGRHVGGPDSWLEPRYRRVRDAVHAAEADTGLPLAFWLGPLASADEVFADAQLEGHAAMLAMVSPDGSSVEVRVAEWAADRIGVTIADGAFGGDAVDGLVELAERVGAVGAPLLRTSRSRRPAPGAGPTGSR